MVKKEARNLYRKKRKELSFSDKLKFDDLLLIQFQKVDLDYLSCMLSFYPMEEHNEVNTFLISDYLQFSNPGLQIAYPKTNMRDHSMQALLPNEEEFIANQYNIPEPKEGIIIDPGHLDLVLVPLLIFDTVGNRVGYGKGFYDRFLKQCRPDCVKMGFSYFEPLPLIEDANEFDVPLDLCITPQKAYVF